jgi:hypothetical protein
MEENLIVIIQLCVGFVEMEHTAPHVLVADIMFHSRYIIINPFTYLLQPPKPPE